jgi:hypothetical protein
MKGTSPVHTLTTDQLVALLGASAEGYYPAEAAAQLICGHRSLLGRADFRAACIQYDHDGTRPDAWIDWAAILAYVERAPLSASEANILRLAAELAGVDCGVPLGDLLCGLDDANARLVLDALAYTLTWGGRR